MITILYDEIRTLKKTSIFSPHVRNREDCRQNFSPGKSLIYFFKHFYWITTFFFFAPKNGLRSQQDCRQNELLPGILKISPRWRNHQECRERVEKSWSLPAKNTKIKRKKSHAKHLRSREDCRQKKICRQSSRLFSGGEKKAVCFSAMI